MTAVNFGILDLDSRPVVQETLDPLAQYGNVLRPNPDEKSFFEELQKIDILIIRLFPADRSFLERLPQLKAIIKAGVGVDHIDVDTATRLGIHVSISLGNHISVAETTILLMLAVARQLPYLNRNVKPDMSRLGIELYGKKLGLVGAGRIGAHVVQIAGSMGMNVLIHDPYVSEQTRMLMEQNGCRFVELEELFRKSDVVSLHCPLTSATRHLVDEKAFEKMKPSAVLVNTARGGIIDEAALVRALQSGRIAGAGLDVVEDEPLKESNPLLRLDNTIVTPHRLIQTTDSLVRQTQSILDSAKAYSRGQVPESSINRNSIKPSVERLLR